MKAGRLPAFFPHPPQDGFVADAEGARDAPDAHPVLVSADHLVLEALVVAGSLGLENKGALAVQALGALPAVLRVAVPADLFAATPGANVDDGGRKHPPASTLLEALATVRFSLPKRA